MSGRHETGVWGNCSHYTCCQKWKRWTLAFSSLFCLFSPRPHSTAWVFLLEFTLSGNSLTDMSLWWHVLSSWQSANYQTTFHVLLEIRKWYNFSNLVLLTPGPALPWSLSDSLLCIVEKGAFSKLWKPVSWNISKGICFLSKSSYLKLIFFVFSIFWRRSLM
jgi:hypothetical protein